MSRITLKKIAFLWLLVKLFSTFWDIWKSLLFLLEPICYFSQWHQLHSFLICLAHLSSNSKYIVLASSSFISMCFTVPICSLINRSPILIFVVNITLALIFNSSNYERPPVCFRFCAFLTWEILEFLGTSSFAGVWVGFLGSVSTEFHCVF